MTEDAGGACPLCDETFDDHVAYRRHLANVHDLRDEPGTRTASPPPPPSTVPESEGRRIGKKPKLDDLPDLWEPVDPDLARRLGREVSPEPLVSPAPAPDES